MPWKDHSGSCWERVERNKEGVSGERCGGSGYKAKMREEVEFKYVLWAEATGLSDSLALGVESGRLQGCLSGFWLKQMNR